MAKFVNREIPEGLTFDDVLLVPAHSDVLPRDVDVTTNFTTDIKLHTPIVSAAMDTVTEADLAIAMARAGGIGVIHKNMTIEQQCEQVRHVKRAENGMIYDPVTISPDANVGNALAMMKKHHIGGIPVVEANGFLIGIVTNRDLRFQEDMQLPISEVMTKENLVTAPKGITLADATKILQHSKVEKLPVVDNDGKLVGLITYKDLMKIKDNPIASKDSKGRLLVAAAAGIKSDTLDRIGLLIDAGADAVVLDTAHGHSEGVLRMIKKACDAYKDFQIIAGNVATAAGAKALADAGVKAVKVGIGPGSICTTRIIAGIGVPQLTAVMEAAYALKGTGVPVIADGGIRYSGDIVKALPISCRRCQHHHGRLPARRNGGIPRRDNHHERPPLQVLPRNGIPRSDGARLEGQVFPGHGVRHQEARTRRNRGPGALQGDRLRGCLSACRRTQGRNGLLRSAYCRGTQERPVRAHHQRRLP